MATAKKKASKSKSKSPKPKSRRAKAIPQLKNSAALADMDGRIAIVRDNLRALVEQAASYSGASDEERMSQRIAEQEAKLERLKKQRDELARAL
ncbi:MAG: hypothetical protein Q8N31_03415 [Reyranella sp.]|nr:hypothetical protein [Reyranella sp.]MDP3159039.1 hypothetical protein [Reyranella sp.]